MNGVTIEVVCCECHKKRSYRCWGQGDLGGYDMAMKAGWRPIGLDMWGCPACVRAMRDRDKKNKKDKRGGT